MTTSSPAAPDTYTAAVASAVRRLHAYLVRRHWTGVALAGPDVGVRFNSRIGRFVKGYLSFVDWRDNLIHAQTQKYWIDVNWQMHDRELGDREATRSMAVLASDYLREAQTPEGYWPYPNPEWRGRIATVEGNYAALGMLQTYARTGDERLLRSAIGWYDYTVNHIGFQADGDTLAINYFGNVRGGRVPNNSASTLPVYAALARATGHDRYLERCGGMVRFLQACQLPSGELPYSVPGDVDANRPHFLCYQYNAFEFLNLATYLDWSGDETIVPVLERLGAYLATGLTASGAARYDCHRDRPELPYYTAAVGAALRRATAMGLGAFGELADRAFRRVLSLQSTNGGFFHSMGNYGLLTDRRSYPRNLSMIASHLLAEVGYGSGPIEHVSGPSEGALSS